MNMINVTSEIGKLKTVMLHRPAGELLLLTPNTLEELLFDDIPYLKNAQAEHDEFAELLRAEGVEVLYLEDLVAETLEANTEVREQFLRDFVQESGVQSVYYKAALYDFLASFTDAKDLVLKTMAGIMFDEVKSPPFETLSGKNTSERVFAKPMPNLYFTRDPFACVGNGVSLNRMYSTTRNRETLYGHYIFHHHPKYGGKVPLLYDRDGTASIEGGDILNISKTCVAVGISQRTTTEAIDEFCQNVFFNSNTEIKTVIALSIPKVRSFMHLDTVFTQIDYDKFTYHPGIMGPLKIFEITKGAKKGEVKISQSDAKLEKILEKYTGASQVDLIPCAGGNVIAAEREQWNDGSNTLCVEAGKVIVYDRNNITNEILEKKGIKLLQMTSGELSRGRGGPRCMSMPFFREDIKN
ncbi:MAG: arginine deiminase [Treponemataceae bacterium]